MQSEQVQEAPEPRNQLPQPIIQHLSKLNTLANSIRELCRQNGAQPESLEPVIRALRVGLSMHPPGADRFAYLNDLAGALLERYKRSGSMADLNESIQVLEDAVSHCPLGHPLRAETLNNLAICLQDRYKEEHTFNDLDRAIHTHEAALSLRPEGHSDRSSSLTNLALCLRDRFKEKGFPDDLHGAISNGRAAVALRPEGHPLRPSCLSALAIALQYSYVLHGTLEDLQESIELLRAALTLYPPHHAERAMVQFNLSISLHYKFRRDGTPPDLDEAIDLLSPLRKRRLLHHAIYLSYITILASCLKDRFQHFGSPADIDEAITLDAVAVEVCPQNHSERSTFLNNLGNSFHWRFSLKGCPSDLDKAIAYHQAALELRQPGHLDRPSSLNNLAICFKQRFEHLNDSEDLTKAIEFNHAALESCPDSRLLRLKPLQNLAGCLVLRFTARGTSSDLSDLTAAIELFQAALSLQPQGLRSYGLHLLAFYLQCRFEHSQSVDDLGESFRLYGQLSEPRDVVSRLDFEAAVGWAVSADKLGHDSAMTAYQTALSFLVRYSAIFPSSVEQYRILKAEISSLGVDAFSYCVRQGDIKSAVELLEQGRTVFWTQLAHFGTPLDELRSSGAEAASLADEFKCIITRLRILFDQTLELQSTQTRQLISELGDVTSRIRTVPGFSRFLLPSDFSELQTTAKDGPVIIMNASQYTCDGVIIFHESDPAHVKLKASKSYLSVLAAQFRRVVDNPKRVTIRDIVTILREIWKSAVEPVVQALQAHAIAPNSRIWWCPTSDFTFLPLHAAGPYRPGQPNLSDLYISSYTPTLGTLCRARNRTRPPAQRPEFAIVGASTPCTGEPPLPSVPAELALVADRVRDHAHITLLADQDATIARATDAVRRSAWLHLACHGIPDPAAPFTSAFALHDGHLTLGALVRARAEFDHRPAFAFLSACRTTVGDAATPDEVMHLAAAMHCGGFRSVVGTVLPVEDSVAGRVVSAFYAHMVDGPAGHLDCSMAAVALHASLKTLRGKIPFDQQIVFVHIGI